MESTNDLMLSRLADIASRTPGFSSPLTLVVAGFLISGRLTADEDYFYGASQSLGAITGLLDMEMLDALGVGFQSLIASSAADVAARKTHEATAPRREFLHMTNVKVRDAAGSLTSFPRMRIRMDQVSAYDIDMSS